MAHGNGAKTTRLDSDSCFIPCRVEPGMFRGEWLVNLEAVDPHCPEQSIRVQLLVDQREVIQIRGTPRRNQPAEGWLRVSLANKREGFAQVVLPEPALPVGESMFVTEDLVKQELET